jgi:hypothetical protein
MKWTTIRITAGIIMALGLMSLLASCTAHLSMAKKHPVEVTSMPVCSECHTDWRASLDHRSDYTAQVLCFTAEADLRRLPCGVLLR